MAGRISTLSPSDTASPGSAGSPLTKTLMWRRRTPRSSRIQPSSAANVLLEGLEQLAHGRRRRSRAPIRSPRASPTVRAAVRSPCRKSTAARAARGPQHADRGPRRPRWRPVPGSARGLSIMCGRRLDVLHSTSRSASSRLASSSDGRIAPATRRARPGRSRNGTWRIRSRGCPRWSEYVVGPPQRWMRNSARRSSAPSRSSAGYCAIGSRRRRPARRSGRRSRGSSPRRRSRRRSSAATAADRSPAGAALTRAGTSRTAPPCRRSRSVAAAQSSGTSRALLGDDRDVLERLAGDRLAVHVALARALLDDAVAQHPRDEARRSRSRRR